MTLEAHAHSNETQTPAYDEAVSVPVKSDETLKTFLHFMASWETAMAESNEEVNGSCVIDTAPLIPDPYRSFPQAKQTTVQTMQR